MYKEKYQSLESNRLILEKQIMLQVLDVHWKEHLAEVDHLRGSIGLRAYAQENPKNEFKQEAYSMFESMLDEIDSETVRILFVIEFASLKAISRLGSSTVSTTSKTFCILMLPVSRSIFTRMLLF